MTAQHLIKMRRQGKPNEYGFVRVVGKCKCGDWCWSYGEEHVHDWANDHARATGAAVEMGGLR